MVFRGKRCNQFNGQPPSYPTELICQRGMEGTFPKGRYVYIHIAYYGALNLCEVEVFGFSQYLVVNGYVGAHFNKLVPSVGIWRHIFGLTLVRVMACCLMAWGHSLTNVDLSSKGLWHLSKCNFIRIAQDDNEFANYTFIYD